MSEQKSCWYSLKNVVNCSNGVIIYKLSALLRISSLSEIQFYVSTLKPLIVTFNCYQTCWYISLIRVFIGQKCETRSIFPSRQKSPQIFLSNQKSVEYAVIAHCFYSRWVILSQQNMFKSKPNIYYIQNQLKEKYFDYWLKKYEKYMKIIPTQSSLALLGTNVTYGQFSRAWRKARKFLRLTKKGCNMFT